jgi:glyoxylase-like metal-dependent hydrolase (beta-lactamase superfamily II)
MRTLIELAPGVLVATSRRYTTTSTVVSLGGAALLVDPAWDPDELVGLAQALDARGLRVTAGFSTHAHHDHLLWHPRFGAAPRWASAATAALAMQERDLLVSSLGPDWPLDLADLVGRVQVADQWIPDPFGDARDDIAQLVTHDGHAPGHTAVWLPGPRVLVAGDMLSDIEVPLPHAPDDLAAYLAGLDALAPFVAQAAVLIPGHGSPTMRPAARLDADRRYLDALLADRDPADPRCALPGMAEAHQRNVEIARKFTGQ